VVAGYRVGADNAVTSRDLQILVDQAAEPVASPDADVVVRRRDVGPAVGWSLAERPMRPVGVVVSDVFAEDVLQVPSAGDEDPVGALAPVGFQKSAAGPDLGFYAVRSYSLTRPPRTGRRLIRSWESSATGWSGRGGRSWRLR
jgi:hypothetical protein